MSEQKSNSIEIAVIGVFLAIAYAFGGTGKFWSHVFMDPSNTAIFLGAALGIIGAVAAVFLAHLLQTKAAKKKMASILLIDLQTAAAYLHTALRGELHPMLTRGNPTVVQKNKLRFLHDHGQLDVARRIRANNLQYKDMGLQILKILKLIELQYDQLIYQHRELSGIENTDLEKWPDTAFETEKLMQLVINYVAQITPLLGKQARIPAAEFKEWVLNIETINKPKENNNTQ
jgi:hypothetical protein